MFVPPSLRQSPVITRRLAIVSFATFLLAVPFSAAFGQLVTATTLQYGADPHEAVDVYRAPGQGNPAVLMIHGGGFVGGNKAAASLVWTCRDLVRHGITCFNIDYRLLRRYDATTHGDAQFIEAQLAMRWVRANAAKFGIDPGKVCAWGTSAGAYYAVLLGLTPATHPGNAVDDPYGEARMLTGFSSQAACVVAIGVPANLPALQNRIVLRLFDILLSPTKSYQDNPRAALEAASPLALVSRRSAPMYIIQGTLDPFFPSATQAQALADALRGEGVPVEYVTYIGGHNFCVDSSVPCRELLPAPAIFPILDRAAAWVAMTVEYPHAPSKRP